MSYPTTSRMSSSSRSYPPSSSSSSSSVFPARLAGQASTSRPRPLTFPLGSLLGFLLGLSAASIWGYASLLSSHRSLVDETTSSLVRLEETRRGIQTQLVQRVGDMGVTSDQLQRVKEDIGNRIASLEGQREREVQVRERIERRVIGLEEENLDMRRRLWRLGKYAKLEQKTAEEQLRRQQDSENLRQQQQRAQRPYGAVLWTGRSQEGQRLV